jgi:5'-nucleotidase
VAAFLLLGLGDAASQETVDLVVLHFNDSHGSLAPLLRSDSTPYGGAARAATLIHQISEQNPERVLVLHAGDLFSRGDLVVPFSGGRVNLEILERMSVDALTPGNGDFYFGVDNLVEQTSRVSVPVVHANIVQGQTGLRLFPPYLLKEVGGVRVAILGLGSVRMDHHSARLLEYLDPLEVARQFAPALRRQSDLLIVLSHLGAILDAALARAVPEIDLIVGGHSHTRLDSLYRVPRPPNPVPIGIAQALHRYVFVGRVDVRMRKTEEGYAVDRLDGHLIPVTADVAADPEVETLIADYTPAMSEVVGTLESTLADPEEGHSPLGDLAAEAIRSATGSDISIIHRGWVGDSLGAGPVTVADILTVHPDREPILTALVKGSIISGLGRLSGRLFSGCDLEDSTIVRIGGIPVDTAAFYTLSGTAHAFNSIDGLTDLTTFRTGYRVETAIERYLRTESYRN